MKKRLRSPTALRDRSCDPLEMRQLVYCVRFLICDTERKEEALRLK
jgi:hypothetical protein